MKTNEQAINCLRKSLGMYFIQIDLNLSNISSPLVANMGIVEHSYSILIMEFINVSLIYLNAV